MISAFSTQHKFQSKRDETLLLQTDLSKANTVIPKPIQWKDVNLPEEWILEGAAPPAIPKQLEPNTELQNVTQYSDGKVKLSFRRSNSTRFSDKESCSSIPSLERKFTKIPSVINLPFQSQPRFSTSDIPSSSIRSVDYSTKVPHPIYTSSQHEQRHEEKEPSPPTSPTFSVVTENVINVIEKNFELDRNLLHNDFYSNDNKEKRLWFFKHFLNQRKEIQQIYYEFVNLHQIHILFFDWFEIYSSDNNISYPFKESNPITIRKKIPEWKLSDSDRTIESEHPPLRSLTVDHGEPPAQIRASPYKIPKPNDSDANLSSIIQQNNFCNTNLNTIGKQLTRIENQFQKSTIAISSVSPVSSKSDSDKKLKEHIFKPFQVSKTSQKFVQKSKSDFAKVIREQLDRIEVASSSSRKVQIAPDTPQSSKIGVLEQDQMSIASSDIEAFKEESIPKANKIHWELALPTVKSPPDLTIDNRPSALNQSRYNASSVYEWNIDGMSEYNILGLLQQMTMAANAYKTQSGTSDKAIAEILIAGFTGQLKGWWDHLLTKQQQLEILDSIQIDENGAPILDEFNSPIQDAVATLILTISLHFIGDPSHLRDKNAELLHNLRCRKLSEFQSYKTTFFTRLFLRDDANHITWKEKFLAGLPTLLGEKVRNSIKALYDNHIPYDELTYGELVSFVNKEGLKICQDLKLQKRLKWELRKSKQELGSFCKQFNYDPFKTSISKDCNVHAFLLPATNSLSILDGSKACMVPTERGKSEEKTLSAMQFKRTFKKDPSFLVSIRELNEEGNNGTSPSQVPPRIQAVLNEYKDVMPPELSKKLPPRREVDHAIELEQGAKPPALAPYRMAPPELEELRRQLKDLLDAGYIRPSKAPFGAPLGKARYFTKLDLRFGYYQVCIAKRDEPKTACTTRYGSFEFLVMPFGLTNAPATFCTLMNKVLQPFLDRFVVVYLDDIVIAGGKLMMENAKVKAILEWEPPSKVPELRSFLGLVNYYRRFIKGYSAKAAPLKNMLKKNRTWHWSEECQRAFEELKKAISEEPILALPDHTKPFKVQTDASDFAIGGVLMQEGHPIAFESRKLNDTERRYTVQEKEMTTIIHCLRVWRHYLLGSHFTIMTDNVATSYFQTQKKLSPKQARWQDFLAKFDYRLEYKPGKANVVADALSRKAELVTLSMSQSKSDLVSRIKEGLQQDPLTKDLLEKVLEGKIRRFWQEEGILLTKGDRMFVPRWGNLRKEVIKECHDSKWAGHPGIERTIALVQALYFWPHMRDDIEAYSEGCGSIMVVVDRYSKYATLIAAPIDCKADEAARLFVKHIMKFWGVPKSIVSDRGPRFTGRFWTELFKMLGTDLKFSTSFHPQTDGQTERINGLLEMYLRHYVRAHQRD
ncbi:Endonuclease [Citrus sinensis]|nr:Endonuclease [Citrus sinensis]